MHHYWRAGASQPSRLNGRIFLYIYLFIYIYIFLRWYVLHVRMRRDDGITRASFYPKSFQNSYTFYVRLYVCCKLVLRDNPWIISLQTMPFVVEERGKENVVPVRLLSKERLAFLNAVCGIGSGQGNA